MADKKTHEGDCPKCYELKRKLDRLRVEVVERQKELVAFKDAARFATGLFSHFPAGLMVYQFIAPGEMFLVSANREARRLMGIGDRECRGQDLEELWPSARSQGLVEVCAKVMGVGAPPAAGKMQFRSKELHRTLRVRVFSLGKNLVCLILEETTEAVPS